MANVSVSLPSDGETIDSADYNTPINTIVNDYNGNIDNSNIAAAAAIAGTKLADSAITTAKIADDAVTPAKWTNPYCFSAYRSSAWNTPNNTTSKVAFNAEDYDINSNFDAATNSRYTAPVDGTYLFIATIAYVASVNSYCALYKNGAEVKRSVQHSASSLGSAISAEIKLTATDYVEVYMFSQSSQTGSTGSTTTYFSGHLVSQT